MINVLLILLNSNLYRHCKQFKISDVNNAHKRVRLKRLRPLFVKKDQNCVKLSEKVFKLVL